MHKLIAQLNLQQIQTNVSQSGGVIPLDKNFSIGGLVSGALPWIFTIAGMLLLVYLVFGGLQLMLSQGDPKAAGAARAHISSALIGFIIIFVAFWIVQLVGIIFNLQGVLTVFK